MIYKINYQLESGITSDNSDGLLAEANDTVLLKKAVQYRIRVALEDTIKESLGESLEIPDGNLSDQEIEDLASQWQSSTGFTENEEDIKQALDALVEAFDKEDSTYDKNADLADKLKYLNELFK